MNRVHRVISAFTVTVFATMGTALPVAQAAAPAAISPGGGKERPVPNPPPASDDGALSGASSPSSPKAGRVDRSRIPVLADGTAKIVIELTDPATAEVFAAAQADETRGARPAGAAQASAVAQLNRVESAQQALLGPLAQLNVTVLYRTQRVLNSIAAIVDAKQLEVIAKLPGVKTIYPLRTYSLDLTSSVPLIGTPQVWRGLPGVTGEGISIGIIDTGIDYLHAGFGGQGGSNPSLYTQNITDVIGDVPGFPGPKVAGGFDFVGDSYNADPESSTYQPVPRPDPDPMDCGPNLGSGHGSHVAGIAGGYGVTADGNTYTGTYGTSTDFSSFKVGPGVAPGATLYALRVFGCDGSTDVVPAALEWAVDPNGDGNFADRLDIVNMSLGSPFGSNSEDDATVAASNNAAKAGVMVVTSAGNEEDVYYVTGSPGTADQVLSVASTIDAASYANGFAVISPTTIAGIYPSADAAWGPRLAQTGPITGTLVRAFDAADDDGPSDLDGCTAIQNTAEVSGNVALIDRGSCDFVVKAANAQAAGAIGLIIGNVPTSADPTTPPGLGGTPEITITIPAIGTNLATRNLLSTTIAASETITVVLTNAYDGQVRSLDPARVDTLSYFSSRGPRRTDSALKPDLAAPGDSIFSIEHGSGTDGKSMSGTSMAAPHVAGAMALLRQLRPTWTVEQLKALAMNTALRDVRTANSLTSTIQNTSRVGAGRIDLVNAAASTGIAYNNVDKGLVSVSFGAPEVAAPMSVTKTIRVENKGTSAMTYVLSYVGQGNIPGVDYTFTPSNSLSVAAAGSELVTVTMTVDPSLMARTRDPGVAPTTAGLRRHFLSEETGYLELTPTALTFDAALSGANEVPTTTTAATGTAMMNYDSVTRQLAFSVTASLTATMADIHLGLPGINGPVVADLLSAGGGVLNPSTSLSGVVTLTQEQAGYLLQGEFYINVHTTDFPDGEIRGPLLNPASSALRVPVYAAPVPISQMSARSMTPSLLITASVGMTPSLILTSSAVQTGSIVLTGTGLSLGTPPTDAIDSLVSAFELQYMSPRLGLARGDDADLKYIGIGSDYAATGNITSTTIYFAISTFGRRNTPLQDEFKVLIDVDKDGEDDFEVFNGPLQSDDFSVLDDVFVSWIRDLDTGEVAIEDFLNGLSAAVDTRPFNSNILILPVWAADLGLTNTTSFSYTVTSFSVDAAVQTQNTDATPSLSYDVANPGLDMSGGFAGVPIWDDQPGETIPVIYRANNIALNKPRAVLLFHHQNGAGFQDEIIGLNHLYMPIISKFDFIN